MQIHDKAIDRAEFARNHLFLVTGAIIFTEVCERLAFYGLSASLQLFFKTVLNQSTAAASVNVSIFIGTCWCTPLFGGWLADAYLNRYYTILVLICVYFIGMASISFTSWRLVNSNVSNDDDHDNHINSVYEYIFWMGLYMVAVGTGMHDIIYMFKKSSCYNGLWYYLIIQFVFVVLLL